MERLTRIRKSKVAAAALAAMVATLLVCAGGASAQTPDRGVMLHSLWWDRGQSDVARELDLAHELGANTVRVDVAWGNIEEYGKGQYNNTYVAALDRFMSAAGARGLKVIAMLWGTPCWASSAPDAHKLGCTPGWWQRDVVQYPPANPSDYADAARWMTSRYGTSLAALEIWNEPNLTDGRFWRAPDPAGDYATLLKAAYPAAKAGNSAVPVLAGALSSVDIPFLQALYAHGAQGSYDGLSVHPYAEDDFAGLRALHDVQLAAGDRAPVWATEFGWPTGAAGWHVSLTDQAAQYGRAFATLASLPWVQGATAYDLRDDGTDPADMEQNFGLVRHDFTPKPAFAAVKAALAGAAPVSGPPLKLSVVVRNAQVVAHGSAAPHQVVRLRTFRCRRARASTAYTRVRANGRFRRRLGRVQALRGCRVRATVVHRHVRAASARVR